MATATATEEQIHEDTYLERAKSVGETISKKVRGDHPTNLSETERVVSALIGGGLLIYGLTRRSWTGKLMATAGTGMLHRAVSGNCKLYSALGIDRTPE